ncbi:MAG: hypothetical protein K2Q32_04795, partial [Alphaproteobacteria bacterium]|nr:hypothetical protein [Alphaproteobacteria bacterium]
IIIRTVRTLGDNYCVADDNERNSFLERQAKISWLPFDVFNDSFPDASSYAFTSTGFITANPRASGDCKKAGMKELGTLFTSFHGLARVMEKVIQGKDVDLFTLQKATGRVYKYRTVFIQWRAGKMVRLQTTNDISQSKRWGKASLDPIYSEISPENPYFLSLLGK